MVLYGKYPIPAPFFIMSDENPQEPFFQRSRRSYVYESGHKPNTPISKRTLLIGVGIAILVILVIFSVFASSNKTTDIPEITPTPAIEIPTPTPIQSEPTEIPTPTVKQSPTPTAKTTPTPTPKTSVTPTVTSGSSVDSATGLDRANLTIAIQNGGGVPGAATKASNFLKSLGYSIASSGNADNFDYGETVIQVKSTKKAYLDLLKKDLSSEYTIGEATFDLTDSTADAVVIVGKN